MGKDIFLEHLNDVVAWFKKLKPKRIVLVHHNDTDGLSSGAILSTCFERMNFALHRYAIEVLHPLSLKALFDQENPAKEDLVVFTDLGSGSLEQINLLNKNNSSILVIDHHTIGSTTEDAKLINCTQFGFEGSYASASTHAYLFAKACEEWNSDLDWLGALGAYGDGFLDSSGTLLGLSNELVQRELVQRDHEQPYQYQGYTYDELKRACDIAGSYGFHAGGVDIAIKALREGPSFGFFECVKPFEQKATELEEQFQKIEIPIQDNIANFQLPDDFKAVGSKSVGLLAQSVLERNTQEHIVIGVQPLNNFIPGFDQVFNDHFKVSFRARGFDLREILPDVFSKLDLSSDVIHPHAAAVILKKSNIPVLIHQIKLACA